jgi:hypothetical protein
LGDKYDLSDIFADPDLEAAQGEFDAMPEEIHDHLIAAIAHKAGLGPDPGKYKGPGLEKED